MKIRPQLLLWVIQASLVLTGRPKPTKGSEHRSAALSKHICTFTVISISFLSKGEI